MSHLYGFHPGTSITQKGTPEIFQAVRKTLDYRLDHGGAGTGWSRAWLINCAARLLDGEMAHEHIQLLFQKSIFKNLFDAHPPFQIDGNFGYTAGIAEMLLQSHEERKLRLLPALPAAWSSGSITGLRARGDIEVDIYWEDNTLAKAVIHAKKTAHVEIVYQDKELPIELTAGKPFTFIPD
jgi:alpha-L-fucosidase 2